MQTTYNQIFTVLFATLFHFGIVKSDQDNNESPDNSGATLDSTSNPTTVGAIVDEELSSTYSTLEVVEHFPDFSENSDTADENLHSVHQTNSTLTESQEEFLEHHGLPLDIPPEIVESFREDHRQNICITQFSVVDPDGNTVRSETTVRKCRPWHEKGWKKIRGSEGRPMKKWKRKHTRVERDASKRGSREPKEKGQRKKRRRTSVRSAKRHE